MKTAIAIFIGGGLGSLARYGISMLFGRTENGFPIGTLGANIMACLILGFAFGFIAKHLEMNDNLKILVTVGFCGGFSTFSTFSFETLNLFQEEKIGLAVLYVGVSVIVCLGAVIAGNYLSKLV